MGRPWYSQHKKERQDGEIVVAFLTENRTKPTPKAMDQTLQCHLTICCFCLQAWCIITMQRAFRELGRAGSSASVSRWYSHTCLGCCSSGISSWRSFPRDRPGCLTGTEFKSWTQEEFLVWDEKWGYSVVHSEPRSFQTHISNKPG